jgi:hypothetical protein
MGGSTKVNPDQVEYDSSTDFSLQTCWPPGTLQTLFFTEVT